MKRLVILILLTYALLCTIARGDENTIAKGKWNSQPADSSTTAPATNDDVQKVLDALKEIKQSPSGSWLTQSNINTLIGLLGIIGAIYLKYTKHDAGVPIVEKPPTPEEIKRVEEYKKSQTSNVAAISAPVLLQQPHTFNEGK